MTYSFISEPYTLSCIEYCGSEFTLHNNINRSLKQNIFLTLMNKKKLFSMNAHHTANKSTLLDLLTDTFTLSSIQESGYTVFSKSHPYSSVDLAIPTATDSYKPHRWYTKCSIERD